MKLAVRTIALNRQGHRLMFDYDGTYYRVAYYEPKVHKRTKKITGEKRIATKRRELFTALLTVFGEAGSKCPFEPRTVEHYIRSTPWGRELP